MYLVLCEAYDAAALWAYHGLKARGVSPIHVVTPQSLVSALKWEHRLGATGVSVQIRLHGGCSIDSAVTRGVVNRIRWFAPGLFAHAAPADRMYANQELTALLLSAVAAMPCPVLNRAAPQGFSGTQLHRSQWAMLAARANLPVLPFHQNSDAEPSGVPGRHTAVPGHNVFVVGGRTTSEALPAGIAKGCAELAAMTGLSLAGFEFTEDWVFVDATPHPDLRLGGAVLLDMLAEALQKPKV